MSGSQPVLKRELNFAHVVALILGSVIGSGVFINLPIVARATGNPYLSIMAWLLGGIIWLPQLFILAEMATAYPEEGFGYLYFKKAGSPLLGFLYVWTVFWTSDTPSITIIALSAISALSFFSPALDGTLMAKLLAALLITVLTLVHYRSVRQGGNLQIVLTTLKLLPLLLLCVLGLTHWGKAGLSAAVPRLEGSSARLLIAGVAATIWSYAGFTNVLYMAGEIKNPARNIPLGLILSVLIVTTIYALIALATCIFVPFTELVGTVGKFANPFQYLPTFASIAAPFLALAAFTSMVGCISALIMLQPRIEFAIARDGLFFKPFAHVHPRYQTPDYSILLQSGLAILLLFCGGIESLLGYFTLSYLVQNALVYGTIFWLRRRDDYRPTYRSPMWLVMTLFAIGTQVYLIYGTALAYPLPGVLAAAGLIATGLPVYYGFRKKWLQA